MDYKGVSRGRFSNIYYFEQNQNSIRTPPKYDSHIAHTTAR